MTALLDVGLPTSSVTDTGGNLTPEWLHAIGRIDRLHALKEQQKTLGELDLGALDVAVSNVETLLDDLLSTLRPNIVAFSDVPASTVASIGGDGVSHGLGTEEYIAMLRLSDQTINFVGGALLTGGAMSIKNSSKWNCTQPAGATSYFTVTAFVE